MYRRFVISSSDGKAVSYERRSIWSSAIERDTAILFVHAHGYCKEVSKEHGEFYVCSVVLSV